MTDRYIERLIVIIVIVAVLYFGSHVIFYLAKGVG
jgi:hypothetical protein